MVQTDKPYKKKNMCHIPCTFTEKKKKETFDGELYFMHSIIKLNLV